MKNRLKLPLLIFTTFLLFSCSSNNDDCTKTITVPKFYWMLNQVYNYNTTQEVPCDYIEPTDAKQIEPPALNGFTYEVISFVFTPNTGNNSSRLQYSIKLNNPNNYAVKGFAIITLNIDGFESTSSQLNRCSRIEANSNCILTYDKETSLDLGMINSVKLIKVAYYLTN